MQNITSHSHIGKDGILHLDLPIEYPDTEVEVKLTVKPIPFPTTNLEDGLGCLKYQGKSLEETRNYCSYKTTVVYSGSRLSDTQNHLSSI